LAFSDRDPVEELMGLRVEDMNPNELVTYLKTYQDAFDRRLAVQGHMERAIFRSMQKIYGTTDAGLIVKWSLYRYKGVYGGEPITFTSFAKGRKWWVDKMHLEMQAHRAKESQASVDPAVIGVGAMRLSDL